MTLVSLSEIMLGSEWLALSPTSVLLGVVAVALAYQFAQARKVRNLERRFECEKPRDEGDRFRYDIFGIPKALELTYHFRRRTSLSYTNALFRRYGETYASNVMGYRLVFTCDSENTKHILSTAFADFDSSPLRRPLFEQITPHGIFTLDGAGWKTSRDQLRGRLANLRKIIDLDQCEEHFQAFLKRVPSGGAVFDVQACTFALSLDIQTQFSLGESIDALSPTQSQEKKQFYDDLFLVKNRIVNDGFRGPLRHLFPRGQFLRACKRTRDFVFQQATREVRKRDRTSEKVDLATESKQISQFTDQSLSILLANDSMSTTLSGMFYCLSKNPPTVHKLRDSIIDMIGLTPPTWADLGSLHYVRWVIFEGEISPEKKKH